MDQLSEVLDSPELAALVSELEATRWTGRPGYPIRSMIGMALAKSMYAVPTWSSTCRLVSEHRALATAIAPTVQAGGYAVDAAGEHVAVEAKLGGEAGAGVHGRHVETCAMDKGYDNNVVYRECEDRDVRPLIPLRRTPDVERGAHKPPTCEHGEWTFAGSDS